MGGYGVGVPSGGPVEREHAHMNTELLQLLMLYTSVWWKQHGV